MKRLPWILCIAHAVLALSVFALAIALPSRFASLPVLISILDYPASLLASSVSDLLGDSLGLTATAVVDAVVYVVIGSTWFLALGFLLYIVLKRLCRGATTDPRETRESGRGS
jgi:hypothetical protein